MSVRDDGRRNRVGQEVVDGRLLVWVVTAVADDHTMVWRADLGEHRVDKVNLSPRYVEVDVPGHDGPVTADTMEDRVAAWLRAQLDAVEVTEDDARQAYENTKARFRTPRPERSPYARRKT